VSLGVSRRRVQRLGGSSLIITLPKDWARKAGIMIGDEVIVVDEGNHLKIVPAKSSQVKSIRALNIKISGYLRSLSPRDLARCAFTAGYDRLIIELPKHGQVDSEKFLQELKESEYVLEAVQVLNIIEAQLLSSKESNRKFIKLISSILLESMEAAARNSKDWVSIERDLDKITIIVDLLARDAFRNKVLSSSGEKLNPMSIGALYTAVKISRRLVRELYELPSSKALPIAQAVGKVIMLTASGASNLSGKRLLEAAEESEKSLNMLSQEEGRAAGLAIALIDSMKEIARTMLCLALGSEN
jgi:phosphate uptake regulator